MSETMSGTTTRTTTTGGTTTTTGTTTPGTTTGGTTTTGTTPETAFTLLTPANNSGVLGLSRATLDGNNLTVDVVALGLTPGQVHPFHLHGFLDDRTERLAVAADDTDGDGFVETAEGEAQAYGPVIAGLTASGDAAFGLEVSQDFPRAAADGTLRFSQTYALNPAVAEDARILDLLNAQFEGRVLEFHGLNLPGGAGAGTQGEVNGAAGYQPAVPVAQGPLFGADEQGIEARTADWLAADSAAFLDRGSAALSLLAPYTLRPGGGGPAAPEPPGAVQPGTDTYAALLAPSNGSGALGVALVNLDRDDSSVTVDMFMTGLTPNEEHASHVHGFANDVRSLLPNYLLDQDLDGFVEDAEGAAVVGPVIFGLTSDGSITNAPLTADFPVADAAGSFSLQQTYDFDTSDPVERTLFTELEQRLTGREVQVHGLTLPATEGEGTAFEVNGQAGYKPGLPVANGILLPVTNAQAAQDLVALARSLESVLANGPTPAVAGGDAAAGNGDTDDGATGVNVAAGDDATDGDVATGDDGADDGAAGGIVAAGDGDTDDGAAGGGVVGEDTVPMLAGDAATEQWFM